MASNEMLFDVDGRLQRRLEPSKLAVLGWFHDDVGQPAALIGNLGGQFWEVFAASGYLEDGKGDPLDRWTRSVLDPLARELDCQVRYPFGTPVWPFLKWAKRATGAAISPIFVNIQPDVGLWWAVRGGVRV